MIARLSGALRNGLLPTPCIATLLFSSTACEKIALLAPSGSTITLSANRVVLPVDGAAEILASVTEQAGTPVHNGTLVTFTTTLGRIEPAEARTSGGVARATLRAGIQSGTATVRAFSGGGELTAELSIVIGAAAAQAVTLNATPTTVPSTGGAVQLVAAVLDAAGNRLPGVPVIFTATAGSLSSGTVITDANGEARATLTTDRSTTVTARAGSVTSSAITITANTPPAIGITIPTSVTAGQPAVFTISVTAPAGGSPIRNVSIDFGDGQSQSLSNVAGTLTATHTYSRAGLYTVIVKATDSAGDESRVSAVVSVQDPAPIGVTFAAVVSPVVNTPVPFSLTTTGIPTGASVSRVEWDFGDGGSATTTGTSTTHVYTSAGRRLVTATVFATNGARGEGQVEINVAPLAPINVNITVAPASPTSNATVTFSAVVSPSTAAIDRYEWGFGDGSTAVTSGSSVQHVYATPGVKHVTVTVVATDGRTADAFAEIQVN